MLVDSFTSPERRAAFRDRRAELIATANSNAELKQHNAIIIGSGSLALHDFDAHVAELGSPFDLDGMRKRKSRFSRVLGRLLSTPTDDQGAADAQPLTLSWVREADYEVFAHKYAYLNYQTMLEDAEIVEGFATLPFMNAVFGKLSGDRLKDHAGILQGYVVAVAEGHPCTRGRTFLDTIAGVQHLLQQLHTRYGPDPAHPAWMSELIASDFDHPAFQLTRAFTDNHRFKY